MKNTSSIRPLHRLGLCVTVLSLFAIAHACSAETLREYAIRTSGRQAYGVYMQGQKAGWMVYETKLETRGIGAAKKEVAASRYEMFMPIKRGGVDMSFKLSITSIYGLTGEGPLLYSEEMDSSSGTVTKYVARPAGGNKLLVILQRGGKEISRKTGVTRETMRAAQKFEHWLTSKPAPGSNYQVYSFDRKLGKDTVSDNIYRGAETMSWGGVPTEIYKMDYKSQGTTVALEVKANGWPIRGRMAGLMDLRAEEESLAKKMTGPSIDLLAASLIKSNQDLGRAGTTEAMQIELTGITDFTMPSSHRQKIVSSAGGTVTLEMRRDFKRPEPEPLSATDTRKYLQATDEYTRTATIQNLAKKIAGNETDPLKKATLLQHWIFVNLRKSMASNSDNATDILKTRAGDCTEHSILFVALARAAGLPAREVGGIMYAGNFPDPIFGWHAWAQVHDGYQWVSIDPTWDQVWVDATHIQFSQEREDWSWMNVLGNLKIKVTSFKSR